MVLLATSLAACGGDDGASESEIEDAKDQVRQEERVKQLERELKRDRAERKRESGGKTTTTAAPKPGTPSGPSSSTKDCGGGLRASSVTTCGFAQNVRSAFESSDSPTVEVFSDATGRTFTMTCRGGANVTCTGGNGAAVYF